MLKKKKAAGIKIITEGPLISKEREGTVSDKSSSEKGEDSVGFFIGLIMGAQLD
jgi:hypothetical protein